MAAESRNEAVELLRSIDATLKQLLALSKARKQGAAPTSDSQAIASDRDLDGKYGNPEIKARDPRDWSGPSMKGRRLSECPPEYLALYAERLDYFAEKAERENETTSSGKPKAKYLRADAARCRGWIRRMESGKHTPKPVDSDPGWAVTDDEEAPSL